MKPTSLRSLPTAGPGPVSAPSSSNSWSRSRLLRPSDHSTRRCSQPSASASDSARCTTRRCVPCAIWVRQQHPLTHRARHRVVAGVADVGGPTLPPGGWTAACDRGFIARDLGVPVVVFGPGSVADQAHRPDESVAIAELVTAARSYALTAQHLLA